MKDSTLHQSKTLAALMDISKHISSSLDYKRIAYNCLISLSENLELEKCALLMPATEGTELSIHVGIGWNSDEKQSIRFSIDNSTPGRVFTSGMPVAIHDINDLPDMHLPEIHREEPGITGFIAVPVLVNQLSIGVLIAYRISNLTMLDEDVNVMKIVASILSQTLKLADLVEEKNKELKIENEQLHAELSQNFDIENFVSRSSAMDNALSMVRKAAATDATVLLRGESGTGKTMIARGIHYASPRRKSPLIIINCASIPETLIESELFGHEKGAFTGAINKRIGKFEAAKGGTVFLDEIGELSLETQVKLLRVIQDNVFERIGSNITRTVDARLICATNADLENKIQEKTFRADLYYRLMVVPVQVPALRSRREDLLPLIYHFLKIHNKKYSKNVVISREGLECLENYSWPGNVRELEHTIERTIILEENNGAPVSNISFLKPIEGSQAMEDILVTEERIVGPTARSERAPYERVPLHEMQVRNVLAESAGIQTLAAKKLGVSLRQLRYAVKKFGLDIKEFKF
jgi:Nif-specific regulatory protein